jgi:copper resistance protein C
MSTALRRPLVAVLLLLGTVLAVPGRTSAHTDLDFTLPTDGASVGEPVSEITVGFTEPVTLVGPGFEVLDPQGNVIVPFAVTDDDRVFRLQLDPPVGGGVVAVAYEVRSADGHVVEGTFTFTVSVPAPTTTTPVTTTATTTTTTSLTTVTTTTLATPTTAAATTTLSATTVPPTAASSTVSTVGSGDGDDSSSAWIYLLVAGAIVIGAGAFVLYRKNPSGGA